MPALAFKKRGRKPSTRTLSRDTQRLLIQYRPPEDHLTGLPHRRRLQQLDSLRWSESGQVTRTSESAVSGGRICLIYRILVWYIPCSTKALSSISITRHSLRGSTLHENSSTLSCRGKRYIVAISDRSSFERSTRPAVTIRAGRTCSTRLSLKY
jgi:hypothetical protein